MIRMADAKQNLLDAARSVFLLHGYKKTSVADIAAAANLAVGSVYKFYPSKKELFIDVYLAENAKIKRELIQSINWENPRHSFPEFLQQITKITAQNKILQAWNEPNFGPELHEKCAQQLQTSEFGQFLRLQTDIWRQQGLLPEQYSVDFLERVLDAAHQIDFTFQIDTEMKSFILAAIIEKLFTEN